MSRPSSVPSVGRAGPRIDSLRPPRRAVTPQKDLGLPPRHRVYPPHSPVGPWDSTQTASLSTATRCGSYPSLKRLNPGEITPGISPHGEQAGLYTTIFDNVPGLQWDARIGCTIQSRRGDLEGSTEPGARARSASSGFATPAQTPAKGKREGRSWTAGTISTRVPSSWGDTHDL